MSPSTTSAPTPTPTSAPTPAPTSAQRALDLIAARGSASLAEAGLAPEEALAIARKRPELEPVYLARFRSRQGRTRVEEVRAYAWPSQQIAMRHLGYRVEEARLLRLEPRRPVPFPARLYAAFAEIPKQLEALRLAEKAWERAIKQAPSKPGRAERDLLAVQPAFRKLGEEVALEMWIEAAAVFQRLDNPTYASKMLGNLLKLVEKDRKVEASPLARTVLAAADDGVFNGKLYDFTWDLIAKKTSVEAALGFGLRVFRRLLESGRPLPSDFTRDLRSAAAKGQVQGFEALFDRQIVWAAGLPAFWNTSRKTASWRDERTQDHAETQLLRKRFIELWARARGNAGGEAWKAEIWGRIQAAMPELTAYGRTVLVETLLAAEQRPGAGEPGREDAGRVLEAALAMLARPPRSSDRERVETAADAAFSHVRAVAQDLLWERAPALDEALRAASGDLTSFVALADLLGDLSDELPPGPGGKTLLAALPGREAAWMAALTASLLRSEGPQTAEGPKEQDEDDDDDDGGEDDSALPIAVLLGEAIALLRPANAPEHLAELGLLIAARLARDLDGGSNFEAWASVLAALRALGPVGAGIAAAATARFVKHAGHGEAFARAAQLAHLLDAPALLEVAESRRVADEALKLLLEEVAPRGEERPLLRPERELGPAHHLDETVRLADGRIAALWAKDPKDQYADDEYREVAFTEISADGAEQRVSSTGNLKGAGIAMLWPALEPADPAQGPRVLAIKDQVVQLLDSSFKQVAKLTLPDSFEDDSYNRSVIVGRRVALIHQSQLAMVVDPSLKPLGTFEAKGWGEWVFLDPPEGHDAIVIAKDYRGIRAIFLGPGREAPPIKLPDYGDPVLAVRTDDGAWFIDYLAKKTRARRRMRLGERGWERVPVEPPARPVFDAFTLTGEDGIAVPGCEHVGYAVDGRPVGVFDFTGELLAKCHDRESSCTLLDLRTGLAVFTDAIVTDATLPARIAAAPHIRAALAAAPAAPVTPHGLPLPRALYGDREGLAAHLRAELEQREAGRAALAELAPYAGAVLTAAAGAVLPVLAARARVLDALAAPAPEAPRIPPHAPGVRRAEIRRMVRSAFSEPQSGLIFWALDGDDPRPALDALVPAGAPVHAGAWQTAIRLVGLAQLARTSRGLAERALRLAEAIADALEHKEARFQLGGRTLQEDEDYESHDGDDEAHVVPVRDTDTEHAALLWEPWGRFRKKEMPVRWEGDLAARSAALQRWIEESLLAPLAPLSLTTLREMPPGGGQHRAEVRLGEHTFRVHVGTKHREDGLDWRILDISGMGPLDAWHVLFERVERAIEGSASAPATVGLVWPRAGVPRREDLESLRRGIALTRARLEDRRALRPESWPAPEIKGLTDPKLCRMVMLAWVLGGLDAEAAGTTRAVLQKIEQATPLVEAGWSSLTPQRQKGKALEISPEFARVRLTSIARAEIAGARSLDSIVVLREPAEIVEAFVKEAGLGAAPKGAAAKTAGTAGAAGGAAKRGGKAQ